MEKSILMKTWEVQAILDNKKTQKRIVAKNIPSIVTRIEKISSGKYAWYCDLQDKSIDPPYQVEDILWVKETWAKIEDFKNYADVEIDTDLKYLYKCDDNGKEHTFIDVGVQKWHPSIHMPREAARIWLKVTDVRVEMLQNISMEDAKAEGFEDGACLEAIEIFESTWKENYNNWNDNPWVWVIEFERTENK